MRVIYISGISLMHLYVIKPSTNEQKKPQIDEIVEKKLAHGFRGKKHRIDDCTAIAITDGEQVLIADIVGCDEFQVSARNGSDRTVSRTNVWFENVRTPSNKVVDTINSIKWTSNNVRYIKID